MIRNKPKFRKSKCIKCKYHGLGGHGYLVNINGKGIHIYCNYSVTGKTCLKPSGPFETIDIRGEDYDDCKLFSPGKRIQEPEI